MERKERITNLYLGALLPAGLLAMLWAVWGISFENVNLGLIALAVVTVFLSSNLRIQLPRTKIHLTISDALIFLALLMYGGQTALLIAVFETLFASWNLRRQGVSMRSKTILINVLITAISVFATSLALLVVFGPRNSTGEAVGTTAFAWMLAVMAIAQFVVNSVCVSAFVAIRSDSTLWRVWNQYCLNALAMYLSGAAVAGVCAKTVVHLNMMLFAATIAFFGIVYITYRRYAEDVSKTAAKADDAERLRAEQAESHVLELKHYVAELEKTGEALRESHQRFRHAAFHDALTGLPNRNYFVDRIATLLASGGKDRFALLFLDLNRFKPINDSLGHSAGDRLIKDVANRLTDLAGGKHIVGRFGGDEFAVLIPIIEEESDATRLADRIAERLAEPMLLLGKHIFTGASVGIAFGKRTYERAEDVLRDADIAMYHAKDIKQNYVIFDPNMHARAVSLLHLESDLRNAIEKKEFEIYYQPIVNLRDLSLGGFEALVRWRHHSRGFVLPMDFIPICESTGLIIPLTQMILAEACGQIKEWCRRTRDRSLFVSVNLSGRHFDDPNLVDHIKQAIVESGIDPRCLKLEITETTVMANAESAIEMLRRIKELGVKLSIDDFGTGYSSLSYLQRFPIDTLKVDRAFVKPMEDGRQNGEIVRVVIALAGVLKLDVVAEGIETIHQLHQLSIMNCDYGQGYLFSPPLPASDVELQIIGSDVWKGLLQAGGISFKPEHDYVDLLPQ